MVLIDLMNCSRGKLTAHPAVEAETVHRMAFWREIRGSRILSRVQLG